MSEVRRILGPIATDFAAMHTGSWRLERPVVDITACIACGSCERNCPTDVIVVTKSPNNVAIDMDYCKGCGVCSDVCPKNCIEMRDEQGGGL